MSSVFPTDLDEFTNPTASDYLNSPSHSAQHADANDAIEALEAKVGKDGSAVATSHDKILASGWPVKITGTLTRDSADDPTYVMKIAGVDWTDKLSLGMRIKWTQDGSVRYGIITKLSFSTDTLVTIYGGTDYDMLDTETYAITNCFASHQKAPLGFPLDPNKWLVELVDTATNRDQSSPSQNVWYNVGSLSLTIPIGVWRVSYRATIASYDTAVSHGVNITLSTSSNSESDYEMTCGSYTDSTGYMVESVMTEKVLTLTSKTTYYLIINTNEGGIDSIGITGVRGQTYIRAICAYL